MPDLDMSELLSDPDFAQSFTIQRSTATFVLGGLHNVMAPLTVTGVVTVARSKDLEQVPEGDRVTGAMLFYTTQAVFLSRKTGTTAGTSDTILWRGDVYRLAFLWPYQDYGFYKSLGVRIVGS